MRHAAVLVTLLSMFATVASAGDWTNWRGPKFNGSADEKNLPDDFGPAKGVVWSADLPGPSAATPIVSGDHVFVSSTNKEAKTLEAMAFDRKTGKPLWKHTVGQGISKDTRSTFSAPSPTADGETVVFFYGNGAMFAYDFAGKELWKKNLGPFAFGWTFSTSPVIFEGVMYMQILQGGGKTASVIIGMEPKSGKELFRVARPSEAKAESLESFNTPMPFEHNGRKELLVSGGDDVTGHDLKTGKELWRWGTWNPSRIGHWRLVPSPVAGDGIILLCAPKREPIYALKAGAEGKLGEDGIAWVSRDARGLTTDVPTPAFADGDFFVLGDQHRTLARVEPKTGKTKWIVAVPGRSKYEASPLVADGKVYTLNFDGEVGVFDMSDGKQIRMIAMEEKGAGKDIRSSIIAAGGHLYIRTSNKLYCFGK